MAQPPTSRPAYDDFSTPAQMRADCVEAGHHLRLERLAERAVAPAPSLRFDDYPREVRKQDIRIDEAAARLAGALHLHLD